MQLGGSGVGAVVLTLGLPVGALVGDTGTSLGGKEGLFVINTGALVGDRVGDTDGVLVSATTGSVVGMALGCA